MQNRNYYFLGSLLPTLTMGEPSELSFLELEHLLKDNLSKHDYERIQLLRRFFDIQNIRSFWKGEELDYRGNFNEHDLEEALLTYEGFPDYIYEYLDRYTTEEERLHNFPALVSAYFTEEQKSAQGFLLEYIKLERDLRLVLLGFRAKLLGRDLVHELQYEDSDDELVIQLLAQRDAAHYEPPQRYSDLKTLFEIHHDDPLELHKALLIYRFNKVDDLIGVDLFSVERIQAYLVQQIMVDTWMELDQAKGKEIVDSIVKEAS